MGFTLAEPSLVAEARGQFRWKRNLPRVVELLIEIGIFVGVFLVTTILQTILAAVAMVPVVFSQLSSGGSFDLSGQVLDSPEFTMIALFATIATIVGAFLYCRFLEGRKISTLGFRTSKIAREYLVGMLVGLVLFSAAVLICVLTGTLTYEGLAYGSAGLIVVFFLGFLIQGMSEEVLCRGYFLISLARKQNLIVAIVVSSSAFGALHLLNDGVSALAIFNIILFGCFMAVYLIKRGNIWGAAAIHSMWNFTQGNIFGIQVSGMSKMESVFAFDATQGGELINGGAFGLEGGLAVTAVLAVALVIALLLKSKDPAPGIASYPPPTAEQRTNF
jgi:membrane protease YdiL (CAAX protease family)